MKALIPRRGTRAAKRVTETVPLPERQMRTLGEDPTAPGAGAVHFAASKNLGGFIDALEASGIDLSEASCEEEITQILVAALSARRRPPAIRGA
jgi:hypothetical protein